ncbi:MAG: hypothetical protein FWG26_00320 [Betaproteobacteria bacterium]|nr:hypothetical protein [Betaproteobacteria bacterium]
MKTPLKFALLVPLSFCALNAQARDTTHYFPIQTAIEMGKAKGDIGDDVRFYFGNQPHSHIDALLTKGITTSKKTNSANKSDEQACNWAMLSALIQLQQAARNQGGNAVVNIESNYKHNVYRSDDQFECHAGNIMAGVALKGDIVKLRH